MAGKCAGSQLDFKVFLKNTYLISVQQKRDESLHPFLFKKLLITVDRRVRLKESLQLYKLCCHWRLLPPGNNTHQALHNIFRH